MIRDPVVGASRSTRPSEVEGHLMGQHDYKIGCEDTTECLTCYQAETPRVDRLVVEQAR
jgi:hypothetical protein